MLTVAGTETATVWSGYLSGAIQAGERAAAEVARALQTGLPEPPRVRTAYTHKYTHPAPWMLLAAVACLLAAAVRALA